MDIDDRVAALRDLRTDLGMLDGARLAGLAADQRREARAMVTGAAFVALFVGMAGSVVPPAPAQASIVPFGPSPELSPIVRLAR